MKKRNMFQSRHGVWQDHQAYDNITMMREESEKRVGEARETAEGGRGEAECER